MNCDDSSVLIFCLKKLICKENTQNDQIDFIGAWASIVLQCKTCVLFYDN